MKWVCVPQVDENASNQEHDQRDVWVRLVIDAISNGARVAFKRDTLKQAAHRLS